MIYVPRPPQEPAEVVVALARRFKDGQTEIEHAREYYKQNPPPRKSYEFQRYKEWEVCQALDALFHEKCAYCESSYRAVDSRDIEHFRPKGAVKEAPLHPGYWWLAASWTNLLPSCPPCNQLRHQLAFEDGITIEEFERARLKEPTATSGKANSFPVRGGNWVTDEHACIAVEDPLLINPCERQPDQHLEWVFDWDRQHYVWEAEPVTPFVRPKLDAGVDDLYAKASIAVYGLNRSGLIRERTARVREIQLACQPVVDAVVDLSGTPAGPAQVRFIGRLAKYKRNLYSFSMSERPYAAMARAFLVQFDAELARFMS